MAVTQGFEPCEPGNVGAPEGQLSESGGGNRSPSIPRRSPQLSTELSMSETIVAAAHLYQLADSDDPRAVPVVVSAPPPARHHNLFALVGGKRPDESGFLTSAGRFVDRAEALKIAVAAGQPLIDHPSRHDTHLFSEDLW